MRLGDRTSAIRTDLRIVTDKIATYRELEQLTTREIGETDMTNIDDLSRYERGVLKLAEVEGSAGEEIVAPLGDLGRYIMEFTFGDIYSRPGLSLRDRELTQSPR